MTFSLKKFNYALDSSYIAKEPSSPRDSAKLLVINRRQNTLTQNIFSDLGNLLGKNDVLVLNQSRVFPARLFGTKNTGGKFELLLTRQLDSQLWEVISKPGLKVGQQLNFSSNLNGQVVERSSTGELVVRFNLQDKDLFKNLEKFGKTPLPPYIRSSSEEKILREKYQTVFAKTIGSVAAPTAGLHFTPRLLNSLKQKGVAIEYITLHVGLGTFQNLRNENIKSKKLHQEYFEISKKVASNLNQAKKQGKRIIAVGTTSTRALESATEEISGQVRVNSGKFYTEIFIYPPYKFKFVDGLITNFHLPKSSLLMLVSALTTFPQTKSQFTTFNKSLMGRAYRIAKQSNYRFFSFGDAMLIL